MDTIAKIILTIHLILTIIGVLALPSRIGKPREPYKYGDFLFTALMTMSLWVAYIYVILK